MSSSSSSDSDSDQRYLFTVHCPADALYYITKGSVLVTRRKHTSLFNRDGDIRQLMNSKEVVVFDTGDFFGAIHAGIHGVYARAMPGTRLRRMTADNYHEFAHE